MDQRLNSSWWALRIALGLAPFWPASTNSSTFLRSGRCTSIPWRYVLCRLHPETFMRAVGVIEMIVGIAILTRWTRLGEHMSQPHGWWALL